MAGWGMTGLLGAGPRRAHAPPARRDGFRLAVVCALAGFAYGALLDLSLMVSYGGEQSLDRYLAISARGVPFNLAHAAGNFALAWRPGRRWCACCCATGGASSSPGGGRRAARAGGRGGGRRLPAGRAGDRRCRPLLPGQAARASGGGVGAASAWLRGAQNGDGGFGFGEGEESSPAMTGWAALGLEAAGRQPARRRPRRRHPDLLPRRHHRPDCRPPATWSARSWPSAAPGSTRATSRAATWSPGCSPARAATAPSAARSTRPPSACSPCGRPARAARSRGPPAGCATTRTRRRLGLRRQRRERRRHHRCRAAGARRVG